MIRCDEFENISHLVFRFLVKLKDFIELIVVFSN
jgi:hypothetical protein